MKLFARWVSLGHLVVFYLYLMTFIRHNVLGSVGEHPLGSVGLVLLLPTILVLGVVPLIAFTEESSAGMALFLAVSSFILVMGMFTAVLILGLVIMEAFGVSETVQQILHITGGMTLGMWLVVFLSAPEKGPVHK